MRALVFVLALTSLAHAQPSPPLSPTPPPALSPAPTPPPAPAPALSPAQPSPPPAPAQPRVAVFSAHVSPGIDPSLGALVEQQLARSAHLLGYARADAATTTRVAAGLSGALTPEAASGLVRATGAVFGLFARVEGAGGRYRVSLQVAATTGAPKAGEATGVSSDLYASIDQTLRALMPPASALAAPPPALAPAPAPAAPPPEEPFPEGRFRVAFGGAGAFGVSPGPFQNFLLGGRGDYRASDQAAFGVGVYYANLKGKQGRAHNILPWAMFEYRIDVGAGWAVPLRFGSGYLAKNGPVVKTAAGLSMPLGDDLELTAELLAPTVWIANERAVLSLDLGAEVGVTF